MSIHVRSSYELKKNMLKLMDKKVIANLRWFFFLNWQYVRRTVLQHIHSLVTDKQKIKYVVYMFLSISSDSINILFWVLKRTSHLDCSF